MKNKFGIPGFDEKGYFKRLVEEGVVNDTVTLSDLKKFDAVLQGSAVKYIWRHEHKGKPIEDLEKAIWFLNRLKAQYEKA